MLHQSQVKSQKEGTQGAYRQLFSVNVSFAKQSWAVEQVRQNDHPKRMTYQSYGHGQSVEEETGLT